MAAANITSDEKDNKPIISRLRKREGGFPQEIPVSKRRRVGLTDKTLDPVKGYFKCRLDINVAHWPTDSDTSNPARCQLHTWATDSLIRKKKMVMLCRHCNVNLCRMCWRIFHETKDLVKEKNQLKKMMMTENNKN